MDLLDLFIKISIQDDASKGMSDLVSTISTQSGVIISQFSNIQAALNQLTDKTVKVDADTEDAKSNVEELSTWMIAKAEVIANAVASAVKSAFNAITSLFQQSLDAMGDYEQQVGAMETFFGDNVSKTVIDNAKNAYETAGMSANEYMSNVSSFAVALISGTVKQREGALEEDTEAQANALDTQLNNLKASLEDQYSARQREMQRESQAYSDQLSDELDNLRDALQQRLNQRKSELDAELKNLKSQLAEQVEQQKEINSQLLDERRKSLEKQYDELSKSLDKEVDAFQKATDARIKEINREYKEKLKLTDEEEYRRLQEIDDQIEALDKQTEAERAANKKRQQEQKLADLRYEAQNAKFIEDREKAEKKISEILATMEQDRKESERKSQKESLKDQKEAIKKEYDEKREQLRTQREEELQEYKDERSDQLKALRESNKEKLAEERESNQQILEQMKKDQAAQIKQMQEDNQLQVEAMQARNSQILNELKESNEHELKERQRANRNALQEMRNAQQDELNQLKRSNAAKLKEQQDFIKKQKKTLKQGNDEGNAYLRATEKDQREAAHLADMALRDMSDNANKMGTSLKSVEYAYQGMARGEFRMLDNLRLGYGQTREEAQRLLKDAEALSASFGETATYSIDNFSDIVKAIHLMQVEMGISGVTVDELKEKMANNDFTIQELNKLGKAWAGDQGSVEANVETARKTIAEMGLTQDDLKGKVGEFSVLLGTTAVESTDTYQGAINKVKGAWENWLASLADPDWDVADSTHELMESVAEAAKIIIPRVAEILEALKKEVIEKAPQIWEEFRKQVENLIPEEAKTKYRDFINFLTGVGAEIQGVIDFFKALHDILKPVADLIKVIMEGLAKIAATLNPTYLQMNVAVENEHEQEEKLRQILMAIADSGGDAFNQEFRDRIQNGDLNELGAIAQEVAGMQLDENLLKGAADNVVNGYYDEVVHKGAEGADPTFKAFNEQLLASGDKYLTEGLLASQGNSVISGFNMAAKKGWDENKSWWENIATWIHENKGPVEKDRELLTSAGRAIIDGFMDSSQSEWNARNGFFSGLSGTIDSFFNGAPNWLTNAGQSIMSGLYDGINQMVSPIMDALSKIVESIVGFFSNIDLFGAGSNIINGFFNGLTDAWSNVSNWISGIGSWIQQNKGPEQYDKQLLIPAGKWIMGGLHAGLKKAFEGDVQPYVTSMADEISNAFGSPVLSPYVNQYGGMAYQNVGYNQFNRDINVVLELDRVQLGRAVYKMNNEETQRVGVSLARGY